MAEHVACREAQRRFDASAFGGHLGVVGEPLPIDGHADHTAGVHQVGCRLVELDDLRQRRQGDAFHAGHGRPAHFVAKDQAVGHQSVEQAERHA